MNSKQSNLDIFIKLITWLEKNLAQGHLFLKIMNSCQLEFLRYHALYKIQYTDFSDPDSKITQATNVPTHVYNVTDA